MSINSVHIYAACFREMKLFFQEHLISSSSINHSVYSTERGVKVSKVLFGGEHSSFPERIRLSRAQAVVALAGSSWKQVIAAHADAVSSDIEQEPAEAVRDMLQLALSRSYQSDRD